MAEKIKYILTVTAPSGLTVRDFPGSESEGAKKLRTVQRGAKLSCAEIITPNNVPYGRILNPSNPAEMGWVRIAEADNNTVYATIYEIPYAPEPPSGDSEIAAALREIAAAIRGK